MHHTDTIIYPTPNHSAAAALVQRQQVNHCYTTFIRPQHILYCLSQTTT